MKKTWLPLIIWLAAVAISVWSYPQLPDQVATHFGINGQPNDYSSKLFAVTSMPVLMLLIWALLVWVPKIDPRKENFPRFLGGYQWIQVATMLVLLVAHITMMMNGLGYAVNISVFTMLSVGVLFVTIGNVMPRFRSNFFVGIRTPWTLSSEETWRRTHALGARIFIISGIAIMLGALAPATWQFAIIIGAVIAIVGGTMIGSYYYYKNSAK